MAVTVTARQRLTPAVRRYAEEKLERLERHTHIDDLSLLIDCDPNRLPAASVEIIVHLYHTRLAAKCDAATVQEAIDLVVDKADRQVLRKKEKVTERKGRVSAAHPPPEPRPRRSIHANAGIHGERRVRLRPLTLDGAIAEADRRGDDHFLYLREEGGGVAVLVRRAGGGFDLVIGDLG